MDSNPNVENIFVSATISATITILTYLLTSVYSSFKNFSFSAYEKLKAIANALILFIYTRAYYLWSNIALLRTNAIFTNRRGFATGSSAILLVVYVVVAFLVATILFPIAMQQVTSAVTTSWNGAVSTVYVVLLPILVIIALALHFLGAI